MELRVNEVKLPEKISFNYEELKQEITEKANVYASMVYTENQVKEAKKDRATLNNFKKSLNDERIRREREYMEPFNTFKAQMNEIISIIDKPVQIIDSQVKAFEEKKKAEKLDTIKNYWNSCTPPFEVDFEKIFSEKWLNASVPLKTVHAEIDARLEHINNDLATLSKLPDFAFESIEVYKDTLDMNKAISEGQRLSDIQKRKAEALKPEPDAFPISNEDVPESPKQWVSFKAYVTVEEALELKDFFNRKKIHFEAI